MLRKCKKRLENDPKAGNKKLKRKNEKSAVILLKK
jgi:hypothetical protein